MSGLFVHRSVHGFPLIYLSCCEPFLRKYLKKKNIHVITAIEMIEYIEDKYSSCEEVTNNKYDLLRKAFIKLNAFQQRMQDTYIERYESR